MGKREVALFFADVLVNGKLKAALLSGNERWVRGYCQNAHSLTEDEFGVLFASTRFARGQEEKYRGTRHELNNREILSLIARRTYIDLGHGE